MSKIRYNYEVLLTFAEHHIDILGPDIRRSFTELLFLWFLCVSEATDIAWEDYESHLLCLFLFCLRLYVAVNNVSVFIWGRLPGLNQY